jgi:lipoprotein-releasing system permease protein
VAFDAVERMVAFRYLRARRREGFISVIAIFSLLGIMLGVATLIIVMAVMNGFRAELLHQILGLNGHLGVFSRQARLTDFDQVAGAVRALPGVTAVYPLVEGQVLAASQRRSAGVVVRALRDGDLAAAPVLAGRIGADALKQFTGDNVLLGSRLALTLGVRPGDNVTLLSPNGQATAFGNVPRIKTYRVAGTFEVGMYQYDSSVLFMPLPAAQLFFQVPDAVTSLQVFLDNPDRAAATRVALSEKLGNAVYVVDWGQSNSALLDAVKIERDVMFIILSLIVLVAALNIISSMIMLVKDKTRAIAILRTMGATRPMILRIFMLSGASVGILGTLAGFVLGVAFTLHIEEIRQLIQGLLHVQLFDPKIYFFAALPARIEVNDVVAVLAMGFGLSLLATLYPAWRAARLDPVEALRHE